MSRYETNALSSSERVLASAWQRRNVMRKIPTDVSEYDVIAKVVQQYINGAKSGRATT